MAKLRAVRMLRWISQSGNLKQEKNRADVVESGKLGILQVSALREVSLD